jgi:esterase/lipase
MSCSAKSDTAWRVWLLGAVCLLITVPRLHAEEVSSQLPSGLAVTAEFHRGEAGAHAILVLHGFMTTRNFNTVRSLANELSDNGYTVLTPTLSLNVDARRASVPCESIHTQTWNDDLAEIDFWVKWLTKRGYDSVLLVGHSTGSLQLVSYVARTPPKAVKKVIATSLVNIRRYTPDEIATAEIAMAQKLQSRKPPPLREYHLVFCDNYTATPAAYLSYIRWTRERVLATLRTSKVPLEVIMGGSDRRFSSDWVEAIRQNNTTVKVIPGANHFFDATSEFELLDAVIQGVRNTP